MIENNFETFKIYKG